MSTNHNNPPSDFKTNLIVLGSAGIGKSAIIKRYLNQPFNDTYNPTGVEQLSTITKVGTASSRMRFFDIGAASLELEIVKKILPVCNLFLLCFSVTDENSFEFIKNLWETKIKNYRQKEESFFCLIGLKNDLLSSKGNVVPKCTTFEQYAIQINIPYLECSAKNNEGVSMVFNTGLFFHYQRHLIKYISPILNHPDPLPDSVNLFQGNKNPDLNLRDPRQIILELFKFENKTIIQFLYNRCFPRILDYFLIDPHASPEAAVLSEFLGFFIDIKNEIAMRSLLQNPSAINQLFTLFFSKSQFSSIPIAKQFGLVRLLISLWDSHFAGMFKLASESNLIEKLLLQADEESKYQLLNIILQTEKKNRANGLNIIHPELMNSCLLQGISFGQHFERLLTCEPPMISLSESIFKLVLQTQETNFSGILDALMYKNYTIINTLLDLMKNPDTCNDAVSFFCSILMVQSNNIPEHISTHIIDILSENQSIFSDLIESPSKILQYNALKLTYHFLQQHNCEIFAKPLLLPSLNIFFLSTRSNVLHYQISQIIKCILLFPTEEYPSILLSKGQLTKRILKAHQISAPGGNSEHFGYLVNISKWIMESPHIGLTEDMIKSPPWKVFYQNVVLEAIQKQGLLPPTIELRDQNHKSKSTLYSGEAI